jgi:aspartate-semialdehyde dehydrogenase
MDRQFAVAVVGATGLVGEMMINVLEERGFPVAQLYPLASNRSLGRSVSFRGRSYPVCELEGFDFAQ